jgi:hypothetical protein
MHGVRLIGQAEYAGGQFAAKVGGVLGLPNPKGHTFQTGGLNQVFVLFQLNKHMAAVNSTKVPQEC